MILNATTTAEAGVRPRRVAVLALPTVVPLDLGIPCQVFGWGRPDLGALRYELSVCGCEAGPVETSMGFTVHVAHGLEALATAELIVVPGVEDVSLPLRPEVAAALRAAHARGACIASICTGAYVLAEAGLLAGRRATTHWRSAQHLASRYPEIQVDASVLYLDEGDVLTSAGLAAGIDLCLHVVRRDYGPAVANAVARRIVMAPHRSGGQAQFIERPVPAGGERGLAATRAWMLERLAEPLSLEAMAAHARMSRRNFARRFLAETGVSPMRWLIEHRVARARELLESTDHSVERIAGQVGFASALSLRQHFARVLRTTPAAYRRTFRVKPVRAAQHTAP